MSNTFDEATMYGSEHSYEQSQSSSRGMTPWYSPGDVGEKAAIAQDPQDQQADTLLFDHRPHPYFAPLKRSSRQRQEQWSNKNAVPAQSHFQTRFMAPPTDSEKAQRSEDDKILMEMKQEGYTYKDIRKKLGRKVAESTLRGRYRSLTKPRSARLRSPKWQDVDVRNPRFNGGALTDCYPDSFDETLCPRRVRQARLLAAFPRCKAEAEQDPLGQDRRQNGGEWWILQVRRCDSEEQVARDVSVYRCSIVLSTQPGVIHLFRRAN